MEQMKEVEAPFAGLPDNFEDYFTTFFSNTQPLLEYGSVQDHLVQIYQTYHKENSLGEMISSKLNGTNISQDDLEELIQVFEDLKKIHDKFNKLMKKASNLEDRSEEFRANLKFNIFFYRSLLDFGKFCQKMEDDHMLQIQQIEGSTEQLIEFLSLEQDQLREGVERFLNGAFEMYSGFSPDRKSEILGIFISQNEAFEDVKSELQMFLFKGEQPDMVQLILSFYEEGAEEQNEVPSETIPEFVTRVKEFFASIVEKKKKNKCALPEDKEIKNLQRLYEFRNNLNQQKIIQIICVDGSYPLFFNKPTAVTEDVLRTIYKILPGQPLKFIGEGEKKEEPTTKFEQKKIHVKETPKQKASKSNARQPKNLEEKELSKIQQVIESQLSSLSGEIEELNSEIRGIQVLCKQHKDACLQIMVRKVQIFIRENDFQHMDKSVPKVQEILKKYQLDLKFSSRIDSIYRQKETSRKIPLMLNLRRDLFGLNLQHIKQVKNQILSRKQCNDADAIVIIGQTGVGKTTLIVGLSGYELVAADTGDFRPKNPEIAKKLKVSNNTMSETRWANVSYLCGSWSKNKIVIIDTPGLEDNRSSEIDITNNIATVKMLKSLSSARIVVGLSEKQFGDRWYDGIKKIIRGIAKYITEVQCFSKNFTFVLSKGLTIEKLDKQFKKFKNNQFFQKESWSENEENLIKIFDNKIKKYKMEDITAIEIQDPSKHNYKELAEHILSGDGTKSPGDYIETSFSREALMHIDWSIDYLKAMCEKTLKLGEFELTEFYLKEIKSLQQVSDKKPLAEIVRSLETYFEQSFNLCEEYLAKFYRESSDSEYLSKFKELQNSLIQLEKHSYLMKVAFDGKQYPKERTKQMIDVALKEDTELLKDPAKIDPAKKKKVLRSLKLIKEFRSETQYKYFYDQIKTQNEGIVNKLKELLNEPKFDEVEWKSYCLRFRNMFNLEEVTLNEIEDMKRLRNIVQEYLDSNPQQNEEINRFLQISKTTNLQGEFYLVCSRFIQKLNKLKADHYIIKELIEPRLKQLMMNLEKLIIFYRMQKDSLMKNMDALDTKKIQEIIMYEKNTKEIYEILTQFDSSQMNKFKSQKEEESTLTQIKDQLRGKIIFLQQEIEKLAINPNPESINPEEIDQILKTIESMIEYMKKRKEAVEGEVQKIKNDQENSRIIKRQLQFMDEILLESSKNLEKIFRKIKKTAQISKVEDYQINYKLIISLLILKEFSLHLGKYFNNMKEQMELVEQNLMEKIQQPLRELQSVTFSNDFEYSKLLSMLFYMQDLDEALIKLAYKAQNFSFLISFKDNAQIQKVLETAFNRILEDGKQFFGVKELLSYHRQIKIASSNIKVEQYSKKKEENLDELSYSLLNKSIKYIKSYEQVKKIQANFIKIRTVQKFKNDYEDLDYYDQIVDRLGQIKTQLNNAHIMKDINRKKLMDYHKQFKFLNGIHEKVQLKEQVYTDIEQIIQKNLMGFIADFESQVEYLTQLYDRIKEGADFDHLKKLLQREDFKDDANKRKFLQLLAFIERQYNKELGELFFEMKSNDQRLEKFEVFINVYQFIDICKLSDYKKNFSFEKILENVCDSFFDSIGQSFENMVTMLKKGKKVDESSINKLKSYERKITYYLYDKYEAYKAKKGINQNYDKKFTREKEEALTLVKNNYIAQGKVDNFFKDFYINAEPEEQIKMKQTIVQKNKQEEKQLEKFFENDHEKLYQLMEKKILETEFLPADLKAQALQTLDKINKKKESLEVSVKVNVQKFVKQSNGLNILKEYANAKQKNSSNLTTITETGVENYFSEQKKKIDFKNITQMKEMLKKNDELFKSDTFKSLSQQGGVVTKASAGFIQQAKAEAKQEVNQIHEELIKFKKELVSQNSKQEFKIYNIKKVQSECSSKALELFNLTKDFPILKEENIETKNMIETQIKKEKKSFTDSIEKMKRISEQIKDKKNLYKPEVEQTLKNTCISKMVYESYKVFNEVQAIEEKVELECIQQFDTDIKKIQENFVASYKDAKNTKIEDYISNDTKDRIEGKIKKIDEDIQFLQNFSGLFVSPDQIPTEIIAEVKQHNKKIYEQFLSQTDQEVTNCFSFEKDLDRGEKARQNDMFYKLVKQNRFESFDRELVDQGQQLGKKIVQKFKQNVEKINQMADEKLPVYKQYMQSYQTIGKDEIILTADQQTLYKTQKDKIQQTMTEEREKKLKAVQEDDPDKDTKKESVEKQISGEKDSQLGTLKLKIEEQKKKIQQSSKVKKQKVDQEVRKLAVEFAHQLIINRRARSYYNYEEAVSKYHIKMEDLMEKIIQKYKSKFIGILYKSLKSCESCYSQVLVDQQKVFARYKALEFADLAKGQTFDKLILEVAQLKGDPKRAKIMLDKHKAYEKIYQDILEEYRLSADYNASQIQIIGTIFSYSQRLKNEYMNDGNSKLQRYALLAYIFALWTILKSDMDEDKNVIFVYKPHPGQILAIFLLLEFDKETPVNKISKSMVQVSTGEGKSVILGALSAYLALVGFTVYEACYSLYLSQRDYKDFEPLFNCLNIKDKIQYNIFPEIFKMMLDEGPNNTFKDKMQKFLNTKSMWQSITNYFKTLVPNHKNENHILLIDEADVFLDENYIGESFFPGINLESPSLRSLFDLIWSLKGDPDQLEPKKITESKQFTNLCNELGHETFKKIVMNQVHAMIRALENYSKDVYSVVHGKIFYKQGDGLSDKIHYGYRTVWAYYHEHFLNDSVSANQLTKQICIKLVIASFSYAKLPSYFKSILGVTGTLEAMAKPQKDILADDFQVKKRYVQPSIYPKGNRKVSFRKCNPINLNQEIIANLELQHSKGRPVIIFFKTKAQTYNFFDCPQFKPFRAESSIITYEVRPEDRDVRIQTSTLDGRITLLTDDFSRGTDFKLKAKNTAENPGLHVISSFLPKSYCDYIQLVGRVGRQGRNGSGMIFIVEDAQILPEKADVKQEEAEKIIREKDDNYWQAKMVDIRAKIVAANKQHDENTTLYTSSPKLENVLNNLYNLNVQPEIKRANSKTAICIDGTGSMSAVFPQVVRVVKNAIPDIYEVIRQAKVEGSFDIKFVIYRNYNSSEELLIQYSNYENNSNVLIKWIEARDVDGGWGNEAIQVCLNHLNSLPKLNQFIIIGDARGNTEAETKQKRTYSTKNMGRQWDSKGFKETFYEPELQKLIGNKVKGHSYYLNPSGTKDFFEDLSKRTSGKCEEFKIDDPNATKMFTDFVANRILENLGECFDAQTQKKMLELYSKVSRKIY